MLCLDIRMANNISLYLMPFPSLSVNRSCENSLNQKSNEGFTRMVSSRLEMRGISRPFPAFRRCRAWTSR
ncbi:hypothetical protein EIN43_10940 [Enterobacter hormaechei]|uniref:Uncharacterized protein n=1 Tax=Enterobacter hormaechei TaxID=158836 RepID=A0A4Y5ZPB3_9ENTR|nr:hypothetical protein EIN43_10940 [Enterobacter hormaechei]